MKSSIQPSQQGNFLLPELRSQLDRRQGLYKLAERIDWGVYEVAFGHLYSEEGRPGLRKDFSVKLVKGVMDRWGSC